MFSPASAREALPQTAEVAADLDFPPDRPASEHAPARTCGHDRPTAAARCAKVRPAMRPAVPLQSGWSGHCLQSCGAGVLDATPPQNSGQVSKSPGPRIPTLRPGLRPEGVALRAVRLTGRDEPGTFGVWLMTSAGGT